MARVHGLKHVDRLGSTYLAEDDAIGAHTQGVLHQIAHGDLTLSLEVGGARFQSDNVGLLQLKFLPRPRW